MAIPAQLKAQIRRQALAFLTETCNILRPTSTVTAQGYTTETLGTAGTAVACRITKWDRSPERDGIVAQQEFSKESYAVRLPHDTDVQTGDVISFSGTQYQVVQLENEWTDIATKTVYVMTVP